MHYKEEERSVPVRSWKLSVLCRSAGDLPHVSDSNNTQNSNILTFPVVWFIRFTKSCFSNSSDKSITRCFGFVLVTTVLATSVVSPYH